MAVISAVSADEKLNENTNLLVCIGWTDRPLCAPALPSCLLLFLSVLVRPMQKIIPVDLARNYLGHQMDFIHYKLENKGELIFSPDKKSIGIQGQNLVVVENCDKSIELQI